MDSKELAEALKGCRLILKFIEPVSGPGEARMFEILEVTPPPKKPEVEVHWLPIWNRESNPTGLGWRTPQTSLADPDYWLRRETIDGVAMQPTVVSAKEQK